MTRFGYAVMIALMGVSLVALIVCSVRQRKGPSQALRASSPQRGEPRMEVKCVEGEPVVFHRLDEHFVVCKASMECGFEQMEERGFDPKDKRHREQAAGYFRKELAYRLADLLLEQGGIRFQLEGNIYRAELKAVLPERSGT